MDEKEEEEEEEEDCLDLEDGLGLGGVAFVVLGLRRCHDMERSAKK